MSKLNKKPLFRITIIIILMIILLLFFLLKGKVKKNYVRDTKNVISPIFAETLIDGKIGSKELIMTCIVDLICRGNIQNIDNDKFRLISRDNLSDYEEQIIDMLFGTNSTISFNEINDIFINSNKGTSTFVKQINQIKEKIINKLLEIGIYSKKAEKILGVIKTFIILIHINIFMLLLNLIGEHIFEDFIVVILANILVLFLIIAIKQDMKKNKMLYPTTTIPKSSLTFLLELFLILIDSFCLVFHPELGVAILLTIILNIVNIRISNLHVLTQKGKEEYKKIYGLKSYIIDFSVINEKDIDSAIIWDKYLAYAVAFSIPNKITSKFNSSLMEASITLQTIDGTLTNKN